MTDGKPDAIRPIGGTIEATAFDTAAQKAAAEAILKHWGDTHNFREIARRTSWSPAHIRKTFNRYFEAADGGDMPTVAEPSGGRRGELRDAYIQGFCDGMAEAMDTDVIVDLVREYLDDTQSDTIDAPED